jgi:RNA polymerase sporulation-specific sigma factor
MSLLEYNPHIGVEIGEFVEQNTKLVWKLVNRYRGLLLHNPHLGDMEDFFCIGQMGLLKAYSKFDPSKFDKVTKFSTYGVPMIIGEIQRHIRDCNATVKFPRSVKENYNKIRKLDLLENTPEFISSETGMDIEDVTVAMEYHSARRAKHLEEVVFHNDGDPITLQDQLADTEADPTTELLLKQFLSTLPDKHQQVFAMHSLGYQQSVIGSRVGVSQVQVSRILQRIFSAATEFGKTQQLNIIREETETMFPAAQGDKEKALELLSTTEISYQEIANQTGCKEASIAYWAKKHRPSVVAKEAARKDSKSGAVTTRTMTMEEKEKYQVPKESEFKPVPVQSKDVRLEQSHKGLPKAELLNLATKFIQYAEGFTGEYVDVVFLIRNAEE